MTEQLRQAMAVAGPEAVQEARLALLAAGDAAFADRSPRCLLYAGLATATADRRGLAGDDEDWPDPLLIAAVETAEYRKPGTTTLVGFELDQVWIANDDRLVYALAVDLIMASVQSWIIIDRALAELETFSDLGDWLEG